MPTLKRFLLDYEVWDANGSMEQLTIELDQDNEPDDVLADNHFENAAHVQSLTVRGYRLLIDAFAEAKGEPVNHRVSQLRSDKDRRDIHGRAVVIRTND